MVEDELVYALSVRPATPRQRWQARLVCVDGGEVAEFNTLAELVLYLAQAQSDRPRSIPPKGSVKGVRHGNVVVDFTNRS